MRRRFAQVDVFGRVPLAGNPVAVVIDGDGLTDAEMAAFARWTNLSETTFVLPPTDAAADYRLRIWTPGGELPFAGHPTLGSAHAWLEAGGAPRTAGRIVQECGVGLVSLRHEGGMLSFEAPPLIRSGAGEPEFVTRAADLIGVTADAVVSAEWASNGPPWFAVELASAADVLAVRPRLAEFGDLALGVYGFYPEGDERLIEVRAFAPGLGVGEDPVTGSLNAGLARALVGSGRVRSSYIAGQGGAIGRDGLVHVTVDGSTIWVGGATHSVLHGTTAL